MLVEASVREFERAPVGRFTSTASCVVWCATPELVGWHLWGRPDEVETRTLLRVLAQYPLLAPRFDAIADTRGVEFVNPKGLAILVSWLVQHQRELRRRIRVQANVIRRDSVGFLLMGILASLGDMHRLETYAGPVEAFRSVAGDAGAELSEEVEAIVEDVRAIPHALVVVRTTLGLNVEATIEDAAKTLSMSPRSLQRVLQQHGTSFHDEQTNVRFTMAQTLLGAGDEKVASVARRVGCSERTLTTLFKERTGLTPGDWRKAGSRTS